MARKSPAQTIQHIQKVTRAWERMAPGTSFYGMTFEQFRRAVKPSEETRKGITAAQGEIERLTRLRNSADTESTRLIQGVANSVKGDPKFGDDSALYAAMGYVRSSRRRKRGKKKP